MVYTVHYRHGHCYENNGKNNTNTTLHRFFLSFMVNITINSSFCFYLGVFNPFITLLLIETVL